MSQTIGRLIGSGSVADVHEYGTRAIKLYRPGIGSEPAFREAATLAALADKGLPVPRVYAAAEFEGRWGLVMDRAPGLPLGRLIAEQPQHATQALVEMVTLQLRFHASPAAGLPSLKWRLAERIGQAPGLPAPRRDGLLARLEQMQDADRLCHGDFHPFNIIGPLGDSMVIDWLDATAGQPSADACRSYLLLRMAAPEFAERYLTLYAARAGLSRDGILGWVPILAAARLTEGIGMAEQAELLRLAMAD